MIYFFSDVDNTLIYSHRLLLQDDRVAVEYLNARVQSYMTKKTYDFLAEAEEIYLIPTTTRTQEQYARLSESFAKFRCRYALVCNGGILLDNNKVDPKWLSETIVIAKEELPSLSEAKKLILSDFSTENIYIVNEIMVYFKTEDTVSAAAKLSSALDTSKLNVCYDSRKVYCIPASINKGNAIRRFSSQTGVAKFVAAGDSLLDIPMLEAASVSIMPSELSNIVMNQQRYVADNSQCFSDYICDVLSELLL